jgi:hypothetical protein
MAEPLAIVRTLTGLTVGELPDAELTALLELNAGVVKRAAADALEVVAGQLITAVSSDDISLDGSKRATVLMARAARFRAQAAEESASSDDGFYFDVVEPVRSRPELTERGYW